MFGFTADPKQRVLRILQKEWRYLLRLSDIATRLTHDEDNKKRDAAIHELRRLRRFERREQMFAPVSKLKHAIQDMASKIEFDARTRRQLQNHVQELEALEASILFETVKRLEPELETPVIDWKGVRATTKKIADNLRGAVIVDQQLRSIIEKAPSGKIAFART